MSAADPVPPWLNTLCDLVGLRMTGAAWENLLTLFHAMPDGERDAKLAALALLGDEEQCREQCMVWLRR